MGVFGEGGTGKSHLIAAIRAWFAVLNPGMHNLGLDRTDTDRDRPILDRVESNRYDRFDSVHLYFQDRLDRSFCSMITRLIRYFNTYCHATSYLCATSKYIIIGRFRSTSSLCLCLQPCDKRLLLPRLTGTELKKFVGEGILLLLAQFDIFLIFLVRLFRFRIVLLFIFFVLRFITITLFTFNRVRSRRIHISFLIVILSLIINLHHFVLFPFAIVLFSIQFNPLLYPFMVANTKVQATAKPSLSDTWVIYEDLFDIAKAALNGLRVLAEWLKEAQTAIEKMWTKLRKYYDKTDKPFAYVDATLLHPGLKKFMKKAGYSVDTIETYVKKAEMRFQNKYDATQRVPRRPTL